MTDVTCLMQWDPRWRGLKLGSGPATIWGGGCVLCAIDNLGRVLGAIEPAVIPPLLNQRFRDAGDVFVNGDEIIVPRAAALCNMEAGDVIEQPTASHVAAELDNSGGVLLRVKHQHGLHTIALVAHALEGFAAFCSVVGKITVDGALEATVNWGTKEKPDLRHYEPVSMRALRRVGQ